MKDLAKTIFGLGITAGLSDREKFVSQVSGLIEQYQQDPEKAEQWATAAVAYMENLRDKFTLQSAIKDATAGTLADGKQMEDLTKAVKALTEQLKSSK